MSWRREGEKSYLFLPGKRKGFCLDLTGKRERGAEMLKGKRDRCCISSPREGQEKHPIPARKRGRGRAAAGGKRSQLTRREKGKERGFIPPGPKGRKKTRWKKRKETELFHHGRGKEKERFD